MKLKVLFLFLIGSVLYTNAETARDVLDKANKAFVEAKGIQASFTLNTEDVKQKVTYSQDGTIDLQGNKFKIEVPDGVTWFDGKTQWSYIKGSDEVNVSNPSGEELAGISPAVLLQLYKKGFKLVDKGLKQDKGKQIRSIELIPESKKADFSKIIINLDKSTLIFTSVQIFYKDGRINHLLINKIKKQLDLPSSTFVFNKSQYPEVEVVDLR